MALFIPGECFHLYSLPWALVSHTAPKHSHLLAFSRALTRHGNLCFPVASQFVAILEGVLAKISRYDEGTLFSSFLSFTVSLNQTVNKRYGR